MAHIDYYGGEFIKMMTSIIEKNDAVLMNDNDAHITFTTDEKQAIKDGYQNILVHLYERRKSQFEQAITFRELVWRTKFEDVFATLVEQFDYTQEDYETAKELYRKIIKTPIYTYEHGLKVDKEDGDISGVRFDSMDDYGLMLLRFNDWGNSLVDPDSLAKTGDTFFVAAAINEMFWMTSDEEKEEAEAEIDESVGHTIEEFMDDNTGIISGSFEQFVGIPFPIKRSSKSIRELFEEYTYEEIKESFEQTLAYLEHPLATIEWEMIFKHAYNTLKYHRTKERFNDVTLRFTFDYDFLTIYKNEEERNIKCVLLGEPVLDYLESPTGSITKHNVFPDDEKIAYAILAYIGDTYTKNPHRFREDERECEMNNEIARLNTIRSELFAKFFKNELDVSSLSLEEFEQLFFCIRYLHDYKLK